MKKTLLITMILSSSLLANYAFTGENTGKIDMHGGKATPLINSTNKLTNMKFNSLNNIAIQEPKEPKKPEDLVKPKTIKNNTIK